MPLDFTRFGLDGTESPHFTIRPSVGIVGSPFELLDELVLNDRLIALDITATKDDATSRATLTFSRGRGVDSLSPAVGGSGLTVAGRPALSPGQWLRVFLDINGFAMGQLWFGRIDRVNAAGADRVTVTCRDFGAVALNGVLRETEVYTSADAILSRIRQVSFDATNQGGHLDLFTGGWHVIEPVATDWITNPYTQQPMTVMEAGRQLVQTFGGDFRVMGRYGWDKLSILSPDADFPRTPSVATIGPDRYTDITELAWGDEDVRNQWEGWYYDPITKAPAGPIYVEDAASIADYGPRFSRIYLDRTSNIDTDVEMDRFLAAALRDSKDPFASHRITMPFYPGVELDDLHTYTANGVEYDTDLQLAVVAYTHHWESTPGVMPTTTIGARGNRIGAYREYRRSVPPAVLVSQTAMTDQIYAKDGTVAFVLDSAA